MAKPSVDPASINSTLFRVGVHSQTVQLEDIPLAARLTAKILLDDMTTLHVKVVHVTVYRVEEMQIPVNVLPGELPPGVEPGEPVVHTVSELVAVNQSDGITPISVDVGQVVKIGLAAQELSPSFDRASGALLITGDTWEPISVPLTFVRGSEVTTEFAPVELTAQQGGTAITTITVQWVSGPAVDVTYHMVEDAEAYLVTMEPALAALRILPGETKTATLAFRVQRECPTGRRFLRIVQTGGLVHERRLPLDITPAPLKPPAPTTPSIEQATAAIDAFYGQHGGHRGRFGFPLDSVQRIGATFFRRHAGGTIQLLSDGPQGRDTTWVRVRFVGFTCISESSKVSTSEEPYFLIGVASTNGANTVRFGPYENVDAGESRYEAGYVAFDPHKITPPVVLGVIAMEHDEGTPEEAEAKVRRVIETLIAKFAQVVGAFAGVSAGSHVIPEWARDILIGWVPEAIAAIFGLGDDEVGRVPMVLFDNKADLLEWRSPPVRGFHGPNEYTHVIRVGENDGPEGQYDLFFKVDLFRDTTEIIGP